MDKLPATDIVPVSFLNVSHVVELGPVRGGRVCAPNWPGVAPPRAIMRARLLAPPRNTLTLALHRARLAVPVREEAPCGEGNGWIEVSLEIITMSVLSDSQAFENKVYVCRFKEYII